MIHKDNFINRISLKNMNFSFSQSLSLLFEDLNFDFKSDESYWIRGHHGSGKSTLLRILAALNFPIAGDLTINDQSVKQLSFKEFLPYRKQIGYSFDLGGLLSNCSLLENLMLPLSYHRLMNTRSASLWIEELAHLFEISPVVHLRPSRVSGSNKKATVVARAFVMKPKVLILDDPTTGLSGSRVSNLIHLIEERRRTKEISFVFFVSEDLSFASRIATRMLEVRQRKLFISS